MTGPNPQLELLDQPRHAEDADTVWLESVLKAAQGWLTAEQILYHLGRVTSDSNKRWLRDLASQSGFILSGQRGYLHLDHATAEEIDHACNWLNSQAVKMAERAGRLRRNAHRLFG